MVDGLYDIGNYIRDAKIGFLNVSGTFDFTRLTLFIVGFSQRNTPVPACNVWENDVGKLVVPDVFLDADQMIEVAKNYDPITKEIRCVRGQKLLIISAEEIKTIFRLSNPSPNLKLIDFKELREVYDA